jgi:predicted HTH domain antitoxin
MSDISFKTSREIENKIDILVNGFHQDKSEIIKNIIQTGLQQILTDFSIGQFTRKKVSMEKAAEIAGISIREMIDILNEKGLPLHISEKSIKEDFEAAMK